MRQILQLMITTNDFERIEMSNFAFLKDFNEYELYDVALEAENLYKYGQFRASLNACRIFLEACCFAICRKFNEAPEYRQESGNKIPVLDISRSFQKIAFSDNTRIDIEKISNDIRTNANEGSHYNSLTQIQLIKKSNSVLISIHELAKWYILRVYPKKSQANKLPKFLNVKPIDIDQKLLNDEKTINNKNEIINKLKKDIESKQEENSILEKDCEDTQSQLDEAKRKLKESANLADTTDKNKIIILKSEYENLQETIYQNRTEKIRLEGKLHYWEKSYKEAKKICDDFEYVKLIKENLEKINHSLAEKIGQLTSKNQELENIIKNKILEVENTTKSNQNSISKNIQLKNEIENDVYNAIKIMESLGIIYITDNTIPNFLAGTTTNQTTIFGLNTFKDLFGKYKNKQGVVNEILNTINRLLEKDLIIKRGYNYALNKKYKF